MILNKLLIISAILGKSISRHTKCRERNISHYDSQSPTPSEQDFFFFFSQKGNACGLADTCSHFKLQCSSDTNCLPKMRNFLTNFPFRELGVFVTIVGSFTYNILLDRDMQCTCKDVARDCSTYVLLPSFIIFFLMLWADKTLQKTCKYTFAYKYYCECKCNCNKSCDRRTEGERTILHGCCFSVKPCVPNYRTELCGVFWSHIFKAVCVGLLWVVSVLVDGDWYVCCQSKKEQSQLACKDKTNITAEENVTIGSLKNTSRVSVSFFLFSFFSQH